MKDEDVTMRGKVSRGQALLMFKCMDVLGRGGSSEWERKIQRVLNTAVS